MAQSSRKPGAGAPAKFILASMLGAFFFFFPINHNGAWKIPLGHVSDIVTEWMRPQLDEIAVGLTVFSAVATIACKLYGARRPLAATLARLFNPGWSWAILRILGAAAIACIYWRIGPEWIYAAEVGGVVMNDLAAVLIVLFFFAGLLLPFLTDYGLMEFIGALVQGSFRRLFTVPGRSALDAAASWIGSGTVGVMITLKQYEQGYYTAREAAVIATNFSIVSTPFCFVIASLLKIDHLFIPYYAVAAASALACAMILPRLPPLSLKPDLYAAGGPAPDATAASSGGAAAGWGQAVARAAGAPPLPATLKQAFVNIFDIWFGLLPCVIIIATLALAAAVHTPVFDTLAIPFRWALELLGVAEAQAAAPAMVIGFADMFLPAIVAQPISSEETRFFIAVITVGQLIYMSEIGVLIIRSAIPVNFFDLVLIFLIRTAVITPFALIGARLLT